MAKLCYLLSTDSYLDLLVGLHNSRITSIISDGIFKCLRGVLINELPAVSCSDKVDVADLDILEK